jgi:hypothetical protein
MKTHQITSAVQARRALGHCERGNAFVVKRHGLTGTPELIVVSRSKSVEMRIAPNRAHILAAFIARNGTGDGLLPDCSQTFAATTPQTP